MWVAEVDGELAGIVAFEVYDEEHLSSPNHQTCMKLQHVRAYAQREETGRIGELRRMSVDPRFQGRGIATKLFHTLRNYAVSTRTNFIMLDVSEPQAPAVRLYKRVGFQEVASWSMWPAPYRVLGLLYDLR